MNSFGYLEILSDNLIPFCYEKFGENGILVQDNDSKHTARVCISVLRNSKVFWVNIKKPFLRKFL